MAKVSINTVKGYGVSAAEGYGNLGAYTPALYAMETLEKFYLATVFSTIANTKYEGMITKQGDKVIIRTRPDVVIKDYVKGATLDYETPEPAEVELIIDQAKYYALNIDEIDKIQNDIDAMTQWSIDAGFQLAITVDRSILNGMYASASEDNCGDAAGAISGAFDFGKPTAPVQVTKDNILDFIVDMETVLNEQNIPLTDRWVILPAYFYGLIEKSDLRSALFTGAGADNPALRNGKSGRIANFDIYTSNNIMGVEDTLGEADVTSYPIMFGHKSALTFASQLVKNETLANPNSFGTLMRGLQVYGYEVVLPKSLGYVWATK